MKIKSAVLLSRGEYDQLVRIYMDCFAEHPWYEKFEPGEVKKDLMELAHSWEGINFIAWKDDIIAGALFARPLIYAGEVYQFLPKEIDAEDVMYVAEVFVRRGFRRQGIARTLLGKCLEMAGRCSYTHIMQRTNFDSKMFPLIEKTGHRLVGIQEVMSKKVMDGVIVEAPDKRGIFLKEL